MDVQQLTALTQNPNVRVMLDVIAKAEGVKHGYSTGFGNTQLASLIDHPRESKTFTQTDGKKNTTTAAGRYQFTKTTWDDVAGKLGLKDFGPSSQDIAAVELLRRAGALDNVLKGDFTSAVKKSGQTWASLPSSPYAQPKKSDKFIQDAVSSAQKNPSSQATVVAEVPSTLKQVIALQTPAIPAGGDPMPAPQLDPNAIVGAETPPAWANQVRQTQIDGTPAEPTAAVKPWEDQLMADALSADVNSARSAAVSQFFGEPVVPQIPVPKQIDDSINRILAKLSA